VACENLTPHALPEPGVKGPFDQHEAALPGATLLAMSDN